MWRKVRINEKNFLSRLSSSDNNHEMILSNFSCIWIEFLTEDELLERCKDMNPLLEAKPEILKKRISELVEYGNDVKIELLENGSQLTLNLISNLNGIFFKFRFDLQLGSSEIFGKKITFPLIQMIEELQARERYLCEELTKKDEEIAEYVLEGSEISRKHIITEPFNRDNYMKRCSTRDSKEAATNLNCLYTFFEKSCGDLYEACSSRKFDMEEALTPEKARKCEDNPKPPEKSTKAKRSVHTRAQSQHDIEDDDETEFSDATYFSKHEKEEKKQKVANKPVSPKKKLSKALYNL